MSKYLKYTLILAPLLFVIILVYGSFDEEHAASTNAMAVIADPSSRKLHVQNNLVAPQPKLPRDDSDSIYLPHESKVKNVFGRFISDNKIPCVVYEVKCREGNCLAIVISTEKLTSAQSNFYISDAFKQNGLHYGISDIVPDFADKDGEKWMFELSMKISG